MRTDRFVGAVNPLRISISFTRQRINASIDALAHFTKQIEDVTIVMKIALSAKDQLKNAPRANLASICWEIPVLTNVHLTA
jgi:hypothetical protein